MKSIYSILFLLLLSCKNDNVSENLPVSNFCGYGVIKFSKSYNGSIRYMEFYPMYNATTPDSTFANKINVSIKRGIIIRGNNSTQLWQDLIKFNNSKMDHYGYYKSLLFIDLSNNTMHYDYKRPIPNEVLLQNKIFRTITYDYINGEFDILKFQIFKSL